MIHVKEASSYICFLHEMSYAAVTYVCVICLPRALSYILLLAAKDQTIFKQSSDIFIIKTLIAYQSISDPTVYRRDHARLIHICATPYR